MVLPPLSVSSPLASLFKPAYPARVSLVENGAKVLDKTFFAVIARQGVQSHHDILFLNLCCERGEITGSSFARVIAVLALKKKTFTNIVRSHLELRLIY